MSCNKKKRVGERGEGAEGGGSTNHLMEKSAINKTTRK